MKAHSHYSVIFHTPGQNVVVREIKYLRNVRKLIKREGDKVYVVDRVTQNQRFYGRERIYRNHPDYPLDNIKAITSFGI
jgi:hypothetical protein